MSNPLVSIIIPLYNSDRFIFDCIDSCRKQTYNNIEILVIDDGSTDNGLKVVKEMAATDKRIKVFHQNNSGVSVARNNGLKKANGEYICFVDADDCLDKAFVRTMVGYMEENESDFCFSVNTYERKENGFNKAEVITSSEAESLLLSQRVSVGCWNKMYKKEALNGIRFRKDLFYGEGLYFINQVAHSVKKIVACGDRLYHYRSINPESATTKFDLKKMINGEKSLSDIKKMIKNDGKRVNRMWAQHYCLFCMNAMIGVSKTTNDKKEFKKWHSKMSGNFISAIRSSGKFKTKLKIVIAFIMPGLYKRIVR